MFVSSALALHDALPILTVKDPLPVLPCASVAEQFTVVAPSAKVDPEAGVQLTASAPSTMSVAEALEGATAPPRAAASLGMFAGSESAGAVVSWTVTVKD